MLKHIIRVKEEVKIAVVYFDELKTVKQVFWADENDDFSDYHKYFYGDADEHKPLAVGDCIGGMGEEDYNGKVVHIYTMPAEMFIKNSKDYIMAGNVSPAGYIPCYWVFVDSTCAEYAWKIEK